MAGQSIHIPAEGAGACALTGTVCYLCWDRLTQCALLTQDSTVYNLSPIAGLAYAVCLTALLVASLRLRWAPPHGMFAVAGSVAAAAGIGLLFTASEGLHILCVCVQGACAVLMLPVWARVFSRIGWHRVLGFAAAGMATAMCAVLLCRWLPAMLEATLVVVPFVSGICAARTMRTMDAWDNAADAAEAPGDGADDATEADARADGELDGIIKQPFPWPFVSVYALCALVAQFFSGVVTKPFVINSNSITLFFTIIVVAVMATMLVWGRFSKSRNVSGFFFLVLVVLIVGLLLFSTGVLNSLILPVALVLAASNCLYGIAWIVLADLVRRYQLRTVPVFAGGMLVCEGTVGLYSGIFVSRAVSMNFATVTSVAMVGIALFAVFYIFSSQLHRRSLEQTAAEAMRAVQQAASTVPEHLTAEQAARAVSVQRARTAEEYGLTARECEVLPLVVQGLSNGDIARELCMSESTVKFHLKNIYAKCDVHTRSELSSLFRV